MMEWMTYAHLLSRNTVEDRTCRRTDKNHHDREDTNQTRRPSKYWPPASNSLCWFEGNGSAWMCIFWFGSRDICGEAFECLRRCWKSSSILMARRRHRSYWGVRSVGLSGPRMSGRSWQESLIWDQYSPSMFLQVNWLSERALLGMIKQLPSPPLSLTTTNWLSISLIFSFGGAVREA